jgi:hypothetical protein
MSTARMLLSAVVYASAIVCGNSAFVRRKALTEEGIATEEGIETTNGKSPVLSDLIADFDRAVTGDVQYLLDFAIIGHAKVQSNPRDCVFPTRFTNHSHSFLLDQTATTAQMSWIGGAYSVLSLPCLY